MKVLKIIIFVIIVCFCNIVSAVNHFTIDNSDSQLLRTSIESTYIETTEISPFNLETPISALCITGKITKISDDYIVRVLLKDKFGHLYCILESYNLLNDDIQFSFTDYCEETCALANIIPVSIKIIIKGAVLTINGISVLDETNKLMNDVRSKQQKVKEAQLESIIQRVNSYNEKHNKLWRAGITPLGLKSFEERQRLLGLNDDETSEGIEYYVDGIFESGTPASLTPTNRLSAYVEKYDWRDRHGQNWITSVKHQGNSAFCYSFCAIGAIEAMMNLYYNNSSLDLDLSEDEGARCPYSYDTYVCGGLAANVLEYAKNFGICDEIAYPFIDSCCIPCKRDLVVPNEIVKIEDYTYIGNSSEETIKGALINNGPMTSGYKGHAMVMVGYATIKEGDVISIHTGTGISYNISINSGDPRIGKTYWIFKNSYGTNAYGCNDGYWFILFNDLNKMREPYYITRPFCTIHTSNNAVNCSDLDGDGYYFWGIGPKPSWCPSWVPNTPDGNDNNSSKGSMDQYGNLETLSTNNTYTISGNVTYTSSQSFKCNIKIPSNTSLTIKNTLNLFGKVKIYIESNGQLIVDGGVVTNADINLSSGGIINLKNGGIIVMQTGKDFTVPTNALLDITNGKIIRSNEF